MPGKLKDKEKTMKITQENYEKIKNVAKKGIASASYTWEGYDGAMYPGRIEIGIDLEGYEDLEVAVLTDEYLKDEVWVETGERYLWEEVSLMACDF
jgi:hypothetical protein